MLSIGITTFKHRYRKYFSPLMTSFTMGRNTEELEFIIAINGEHKEKFDENYRSEILMEMSCWKNTYPMMFPKFRGLSKLWNSIVINATEEYILLLNDDVTITASNFIQHVKECIAQCQTSFKINGSWSHVVLKRSEIAEVGYFDERLLGIGEEDGDFEWRYQEKFGKGFLSLNIPGIVNHVDMSHIPTNITPGIGKYSKFNRDYMFNGIYQVKPEGKVLGMISEPLVRNEMKEQYPHEKFFEENKDKL